MTTANDSMVGWPNDYRAPFFHAAVITPSDTNDLTQVTRAIRVQGAGTMKVDTYGREIAVTLNFNAGETRDLRVTRIYATGTTATGIEALW